jgi:hypothetical protein
MIKFIHEPASTATPVGNLERFTSVIEPSGQELRGISDDDVKQLLTFCRQQFGRETRLKARWSYRLHQCEATPLLFKEKVFQQEDAAFRSPWRIMVNVLTIAFKDPSDAVIFKLQTT